MDREGAAVQGLVVPEYGEAEVDLTPLTPEERRYVYLHQEDLADNLVNGRQLKTARPVEATEYAMIRVVRAALADASHYLVEQDQQRTARAAAQRETREYEVQVALAGGYAEFPRNWTVVSTEIDGQSTVELRPDCVPQDPRITLEAIARLERICAEETELRYGEGNRRSAAVQELAKVVRQEQQRTRDNWVAEHGSAEQTARHLRGLLPESEILDGLRTLAFAPAGDRARYSKLVRSDVIHDDYCDSPLTYVVEGEDQVTAEQFAELSALEQVFPAPATVRLRRHTGNCGCPQDQPRPGSAPPVHRWSFLVHVPCGGYELSREYVAPDGRVPGESDDD